ncbi:hypothetical protein AB870_09180 [Pandoraea faecigallinarum]|uniref:Immunity protein 42 n=1 Tax=Pandoraea faecigallinarum TaxID=656179 RepID=A0A0H3WRK0_9BURK|nr:Imm42 family immunity protein [Pandoraea faecigallinarum]AKM30240.1 hypothetical protein AB870_09180 [Pandoraea faecigallinarum]
MLFGDKARLGIEFELNENPGDAWMFGKFCYWIAGEQVGNFDEGVSLRDVLFSMRYIVGDAGKREAPSLVFCDEIAVFHVIQNSISESDLNMVSSIPPDISPACFDICPNLDIFNRWNIYLVDAEDISKIIYSEDAGVTVKTVEILPGEFDSVASSAYQELDRIFEASQ